MNSDYQVDQQAGPIGATISGIDLNNIDSTAVDFLREALSEHLVLFFRDQSLDPANLFKLASKFGSPVPYPFVKGLPSFPEVVEVIKRPEDTLNFGGVWHSDTTYLETPAMGALLYGVDIPEQGWRHHVHQHVQRIRFAFSRNAKLPWTADGDKRCG